MATLEQDLPAFYTIKIGPPVWPGGETELTLIIRDKGITTFEIYDYGIQNFRKATGLEIPIDSIKVELHLEWNGSSIYDSRVMIYYISDNSDRIADCTLNDYGLKELLQKAFFATEWIWRDSPE